MALIDRKSSNGLQGNAQNEANKEKKKL